MGDGEKQHKFDTAELTVLFKPTTAPGAFFPGNVRHKAAGLGSIPTMYGSLDGRRTSLRVRRSYRLDNMTDLLFTVNFFRANEHLNKPALREPDALSPHLLSDFDPPYPPYGTQIIYLNIYSQFNFLFVQARRHLVGSGRSEHVPM
jgi:hypothetical protein